MSERMRQMYRVEETATELMYAAEKWAAAMTSHDAKFRRRELLRAARDYGRAMDALARVR
jgi:hypothetical protein